MASLRSDAVGRPTNQESLDGDGGVCRLDAVEVGAVYHPVFPSRSVCASGGDAHSGRPFFGKDRRVGLPCPTIDRADSGPCLPAGRRRDLLDGASIPKRVGMESIGPGKVLEAGGDGDLRADASAVGQAGIQETEGSNTAGVCRDRWTKRGMAARRRESIDRSLP